MARVANVKMPWLLAFARHVEAKVKDAHKPRGEALNYKLNTLLGSRRRRNLPCNAEDNLCVEHLFIEAWFGGY